MKEIIVVDDMPDFTRSLKDILEIEGHNLKVYDEPKEFLEFSRTARIYGCDKLIVDYSMPEVNGFQLFRELYSNTKGNLPFDMLLYSANLEQISDEQKEFLSSIGVNFLKKPNIMELLNFMQKNEG